MFVSNYSCGQLVITVVRRYVLVEKRQWWCNCWRCLLFGFFSTSIDAHFSCDSSRCKAENDQPTTLPFNPLFPRLHRYTGWRDVYHVKCTRVHQEMITPFHFIGHDGGDGDVDGGNGDNTSTLSTLQGALPDGGQWVRTFRVTSLPTSDPGHLLRFYLNVILEMRYHRLYCL